MSNIQTTNGINKNEPHMSAETYESVMSWDHYPEPKSGERQVELGMHVRMPFTVSDLDVYLLPQCAARPEEIHGAGFCEGNHYGEKPKPKASTPVPKESWQTPSSKAVWLKHVDDLRKKEEASIMSVVHPEVPHVCGICRDLSASKKTCKLPEQGMGSLCSSYRKHCGVIILPENKRAVREWPYYGSLRHKLDEFERKNRPAKIWRESRLPTFNRSDGEFIRTDIDELGNRINVYRDSNPRLVPEAAFSHDRNEDNSEYDECAFPDDWQMDSAEAGDNKDDYIYADTPDRDIKSQCFEMPKPVWYLSDRPYYTGRQIIGFRPYYMQDKRTELVRVWKPVDRSFPECIWWYWKPKTHAFTFTVEEREVVVSVRRNLPITKATMARRLINTQTEEQFNKEIMEMAKVTGRSEDELRAEGTILVQSSTVVTKKDRRYFNAKREQERQKRMLTGYLIKKDATEGAAMPRPKHHWPVRSNRAVAPTVSGGR